MRFEPPVEEGDRVVMLVGIVSPRTHRQDVALRKARIFNLTGRQ